MTDIDHPNPDRKKIIALYAALGATLVMSVVPSLTACALSLVFFLGVMIAAYVLRGGAGEDSLMENHATFVIRTIWIGGFLAMFTTSAAALYLLARASLDYAPLMPCMDRLMTMNPDQMAAGLEAEQAMFESCLWAFIHANLKSFIIAGAIAAGPVLIYFLGRFARGLSRAARGYRLAKPKAWF